MTSLDIRVLLIFAKEFMASSLSWFCFLAKADFEIQPSSPLSNVVSGLANDA